MKLTSLFFQTFKEDPAEAEIESHKLMLRAGFIKKLSSGIYSFMPLCWRTLKKIKNIIIEEMDRIGAQEIFMPTLHPINLWMETGRYDVYRKENILFITTDRKGSQYLLGPTHEEVVTDVVRSKVKSYKDLPVMLYQIQTKFRDEIRPRFGITRAREFLMKDAYSFDESFERLNDSYNLFFEAYKKIFTRCGLNFAIAEAYSGAIGGDVSHEFMALTDVGEDIIVSCNSCDYCANLEKASAWVPLSKDVDQELLPLKLLHTPQIKTVKELANFTSILPTNMIKTLFYMFDDQPVAILIRGDREINEIKLKNTFKVNNVEMADEETIVSITNAKVGFAGPVGLKNIIIIMDESLRGGTNFLSGANKTDYHYININFGRDFKPSLIAEIKIAEEGDICPKCKNRLKISKGIELGHTFKLGEKYSRAMNALFVNRKGEYEYIKMGCYGIGVGRIMVAAIEQNHNENGINFPFLIAPYEVIIIPVNIAFPEIGKVANNLYDEMLKRRYEVLFDDRDVSAGIKFKDADLMGIPIKVIIGKSLKEGKVEIKSQIGRELVSADVKKTIEKVDEIIATLKSNYSA